jgi:hypothetical protein
VVELAALPHISQQAVCAEYIRDTHEHPIELQDGGASRIRAVPPDVEFPECVRQPEPDVLLELVNSILGQARL